MVAISLPQSSSGGMSSQLSSVPCPVNGQYIPERAQKYWNELPNLQKITPYLDPCDVAQITEFFLTAAEFLSPKAFQRTLDPTQFQEHKREVVNLFSDESLPPIMSSRFETLKAVSNPSEMVDFLGDISTIVLSVNFVETQTNFTRLAELHCPRQEVDQKCKDFALENFALVDPKLGRLYSLFFKEQERLANKIGRVKEAQTGDPVMQGLIRGIKSPNDLKKNLESILGNNLALRYYEYLEHLEQHGDTRFPMMWETAQSFALFLNEKAKENPDLREALKLAFKEGREFKERLWWDTFYATAIIGGIVGLMSWGCKCPCRNE